MTDETQKIRERYEKRKNNSLIKQNNANLYFNHFAQSERELKYAEIIQENFSDPENIKFLEIGAGSGGNLFFFKKIGFLWENIHANELLPDRLDVLKKTFPQIQIHSGDACAIEKQFEKNFDLVFQSTVFTSILDLDFKKKLAEKMWSLLRDKGIILWYDFSFDNPNNPDVKGVTAKEITSLFPLARKITFYKTTLAPPIGRRIGKFYPLINLLPFLRTHLIAVIEK